MTYDASFDQMRLDMLARQHLENSDAVGSVIYSSNNEKQLDHATWRFPNADYVAFGESGFKMHLMELFDTLITYRTQCTQPNSGQGVVNVQGNQLSIEWLTLAEVEALRED
ncbi:hypothetical protein CBP31_07235 [Oceanisphaera profunda]|uniref:Uncharacterized protein n=2 Tax=Oceanisphaera profunda TaxID=1416627 RepID=A0A1Y0D4J6_9GAMM|nr:hypothetical protein CBP31_07235 [Oceanisphaera profunda]